MDYMLYFTIYMLLRVFSVSEAQPVTNTNSVLLKLPKEMSNGTFISITGEINNIDPLSIAISGDNTEEKCKIVFNPSLQHIKVISKTENNTTYNLDHNGKNPVPFSLNITARTVLEETENHFIDLDFEGNEAGPEVLPRCEFTFFYSIEYIHIKGIQHLRISIPMSAYIFKSPVYSSPRSELAKQLCSLVTVVINDPLRELTYAHLNYIKKQDTMLKTCLDCLAGSRVDHEVYGTVLNGQTSTAWPEPHLQNEIMFRLPRPLNANDEIEVSGKMIPNPERLFLNLITGSSFPDYQNIACQVEASFLLQNIILRSIENGNKYEETLDQYPSDLFPDSEFKFIIKVRVNGSHILDIDIGESYAGSVELKHNLRDITFLSLSNDITKVEELKFRYA